MKGELVYKDSATIALSSQLNLDSCTQMMVAQLHTACRQGPEPLSGELGCLDPGHFSSRGHHLCSAIGKQTGGQ
jgi:hypothetical protein